MTRNEITPKMLRDLILYDAKTGKLFWKHRDARWFAKTKRAPEHSAKIWNKRFSGREITSDALGGYFGVRLLGNGFFAHRVAFAIAHGEWPDGDIDHINGDRKDNSLSNLRAVSRAENMRNKALSHDCKGGHFGVRFEPKLQKWRAKIGHNYRHIHLGVYDTEEEAVAARKEAERKLGFHRNHGRRPDPSTGGSCAFHQKEKTIG